MKNLITLLSLILIGVFGVQAAESASDIVARSADKLSKAPSISAHYTITSGGSSSSGDIILSGQRFYISSPQLHIWYDGTTQWTYIPADNEVSITEPTADELNQVNPFSIISAFKHGYTATLVKSNKTTKTISLSARSKSAEVQKATLTLATNTMLPGRIDLTMKSGQKMSIAINSIYQGKSQNIATFRFPKQKYSGAEIVDLR